MKLFTHVAFLMLFALPLLASAQTTPLRIIEIPKPEIPKIQGVTYIEDDVQFRVEFLATGKIGKFVYLSGGSPEMVDLAALSVRKIKFEPQAVDGTPVSIDQIVEYAYNSDTGWRMNLVPPPEQDANAAQTTPLRILEIPRPDIPENAGTLDVTDTFMFKVEFLASGKIGKVVRISGTHKELAQLATDATKRIKFEPKMVDRVPVSVARIVRYSYSYDGGWQTEPKLSASGQVSVLSGPPTQLQRSTKIGRL